MEATFANLQKDGKNTVDNLVKWMKDAKIVDQGKPAEDQARKMLTEASDKGKVSQEKFKEVLGKMAENDKKNVDDYKSSLASAGQQLSEALSGAAGTAANAIAGMFK